MEPAPATSSFAAAPIGGYFQGGKSKFKQLPFAADGSGRLLVRHRKLRVFPTKAGVAMPAAELEAVCKGLAATQCVQMLHLGELRFALGGDDEENALQPLVQLLVRLPLAQPAPRKVRLPGDAGLGILERQRALVQLEVRGGAVAEDRVIVGVVGQSLRVVLDREPVVARLERRVARLLGGRHIAGFVKSPADAQPKLREDAAESSPAVHPVWTGFS